MTTEKLQIDTAENRDILHTLVPLLIDWFSKNARKLPWRENPTPYKIWISEVMLQQTRVEAVKEYYNNFLNHFPTLSSLADADEEELSKCWQGLGYYSRMHNLQRCARVLIDSGKTTLPSDYKTLLSLPVGYIAMGVTQSLSGVMRGAGDTTTPMWISLLSTIVIRVPIAYLINHFTHSPDCLYISLLISWICGALMTVLAYRFGKWHTKGLTLAAANQSAKPAAAKEAPADIEDPTIQ